MAFMVRTTSKPLLGCNVVRFNYTAKVTHSSGHLLQRSLRSLMVGTGVASLGGAVMVIYALEHSVNASDFYVHPQELPWPHSGLLSSFDYKSVRRGYQVYKQVCAACHSMKFHKYRMFIDAFMTADEVKTESAEILVDDTDDDGNPIQRPGTPLDSLPKPYPNVKAAKAANGGSLPPDLSFMAFARHGGDDYIFSLLTGYCDPPSGVSVDEGKAYNPYFPSRVIAMPQQLFDDGVEYSDGTPATISQQAKDVSSFLHWAAEPYHDTRKRYGLKALVMLPLVTFVCIYWKRHSWTFLKSQRFAWKTVKGRERPKS